MAANTNQAFLFLSLSFLLFTSPSPSSAQSSPSPSPYSAQSSLSPASSSYSDEDGPSMSSFELSPSPSSYEPSPSPSSYSAEPSPSPSSFSGEPPQSAISSPQSQPFPSSSPMGSESESESESPSSNDEINILSPNSQQDPTETIDLNAPTSNSLDPAATPPISSTNPEIKSICSKTDYPGLCLTAVAPFVTNNVDHFSVLEMAIRAVANNVKVALSTAKKFSTSLHSSNDGTLSVCNENYDDALYNLQSAIDAIATRDTGTISSMLSAAISDFSTCSDEISGSGKPLPMKDFGDKLSKMTSNCLAIASTVK